MKPLSVAIFLHLLIWHWQEVFAQKIADERQSDLFDDSQYEIFKCFKSCADGYTGNEVLPGSGCKVYQECFKGEVKLRNHCGPPLLFDVERDYCNFPSETFCAVGSEDVGCPRTNSPNKSPGDDEMYSPAISPEITDAENPEPVQQPVQQTEPTQQPVEQPKPTQKPTQQPVSDAPTIDRKTEAPIKGGGSVITHVNSKKYLIEKNILVSYNRAASDLAYPSIRYTYDKLMVALQIMGVDGFGADFKFELWEGNEEKYLYGLVNLALFLANSMVESIEADTCDELNWDQTAGRYAISNSCGQESRSYQDETCDDMDDDIFSCGVIPESEITAASAAVAELAPPPFQCKPGSGEGYHSGYWDSGTLIANAPYSNKLGRTDTEGCCFWGRGALSTRGVCNHGKINYYLGKKGADLGRSTLYPTEDFCEFPEATCLGEHAEELRWSIAFFEWAERIQRYESNGWDYEGKLTEFVDNGMIDDTFIDSVSRILSRGYHISGCSSREARMLDERRSNVYLIINDIFDIKTLLDPLDPTRQATTMQPTTMQPARQPTSSITTTPNPVENQNLFSPPKSSPSPQTLPVPTTSNQNPIENPNIIPSPTEPILTSRSPIKSPDLISLEDSGATFSQYRQISISLILSLGASCSLLLLG